MRLFAFLLALVLAIVALGYLLLLNPESVTLHLPRGATFEAPLPLLLAGSILLGAVLAVLLGLAREGRRRLAQWLERRQQRRGAKLNEALAAGHDMIRFGEYARARAVLARAARRTDTVPASLLLAEAYLREGDALASRRLLEEAHLRHGNEPRLLALLADACAALGDHAASASALERALALRPESPRLRSSLRDAYMALGRWRDAATVQNELLGALRKGAALDAERRLLAGLRYQAALADSDGTLGELQELVSREPSFVPAAVTLGELLVAKGQVASARRVWGRALRRRPDAVLLSRLGSLYRQSGQHRRAGRLYRWLLRHHPEDHAVRLLYARYLLEEKQPGSAAAVLSEAPPSVRDSALAQALWAQVHEQQGNSELALSSFRQAARERLDLLAPYRCEACLRASEEWSGRCACCGAWGTLQAAVEVVARG